MQLAKFRWRRLAAALGIGLGVEVLAICVVSFLPSRWADAIGELPLESASYLVTLLAKTEHSGFESQVGYFFLAVVLQWLIYSVVVYLFLAIARRKRVSGDTAPSIKQI